MLEQLEGLKVIEGRVDGRKYKLITREEIQKFILSAKAFIKNHYKDTPEILEVINDKIKAKKKLPNEIDFLLPIHNIYYFIMDKALTKKYNMYHNIVLLHEWNTGDSVEAFIDKDGSYNSSVRPILEKKVTLEDFLKKDSSLDTLVYYQFLNVNEISQQDIDYKKFIEIEKQIVKQQKTNKRK